MNEIWVSAIRLVLLMTAPLNSRRYQCVQPAAQHSRLLECGDFFYLLVSGVSAGENVDCICCFIWEIFIDATVMNKADKVPALMELY